ncbi:hypothetical protein ACHAXT_002828 [Thalassiosira profunda]
MSKRPRKRPQSSSRLFATLASVEAADASAAKRRRKSQQQSLRQSRAAAGQAKLHGVLLELRILVQRCLTEGDAAVAAGNGGGDAGGVSSCERAAEGADALLENLLAARRELMGHQLGDAKTAGDEGADDDSDEDEETEGVDYAKLIRQTKGDDDGSSSDEEGSSSDSAGDGPALAAQLQSEHASLRTHWQSILNKHHAALTLHSGMTSGTKFQSRAVDVSFWEQVRGGMEHERFKRRTAAKSDNGGDGETNEGVGGLAFDDAKLYQQMLRDFISSSSDRSTNTTQRGAAVDPAREAAERLKRAVRKKSGDTGDVDLTALLIDASGEANGLAGPAAKKKANTVDRRASKGRKLRYAVHPKLANFTFPVARAEPAIGEDVWFKSLFGAGKR